MAGKSTYLRQTALIVLLAQIGAFVPAASARLGLVDRIFARVGAQDRIAAGRSTFMVEMLETAAILSAATPRSLLVLDEIGRGTSTYDGLAIARALLEHLVAGREGPRTLFATHFHELTALAGEAERVANASVLVGETPDGEGLRFLYRIVPGGADRSHGVQVAAMAGLPAPLLARARALLTAFESAAAGSSPSGAEARSLAAVAPPPFESSPGEPLLRELAALDVDGLTPLEAIAALYALRERARALRPGAAGAPPPGRQLQLLRGAAR
jgi:DNA mismatch repair protein MutS